MRGEEADDWRGGPMPVDELNRSSNGVRESQTPLIFPGPVPAG